MRFYFFDPSTSPQLHSSCKINLSNKIKTEANSTISSLPSLSYDISCRIIIIVIASRMDLDLDELLASQVPADGNQKKTNSKAYENNADGDFFNFESSSVSKSFKGSTDFDFDNEPPPARKKKAVVAEDDDL